MNNQDDEEVILNTEEEEIFIDSYADRRKGRSVVVRGFQSFFKKAKKDKKMQLYLPINGPQTSPDEWARFYRENRSGRTANERGTRIDKCAFYQFLKKEPRNPSSELYYYALPKGFTQTDLVNAETDYNYMIGTGSVLWDFRPEQKLSRKVGLCSLRKRG